MSQGEFVPIGAPALLPGVCDVDLPMLLRPPNRHPGESYRYGQVEGYLIAARVFGLRALPVGIVGIYTVYPPGLTAWSVPPADPARISVVVLDCDAPVLVVPLAEWQQRITAWLDKHTISDERTS